jgi:hypothetical protein
MKKENLILIQLKKINNKKYKKWQKLK